MDNPFRAVSCSLHICSLVRVSPFRGLHICSLAPAFRAAFSHICSLARVRKSGSRLNFSENFMNHLQQQEFKARSCTALGREINHLRVRTTARAHSVREGGWQQSQLSVPLYAWNNSKVEHSVREGDASGRAALCSSYAWSCAAHMVPHLRPEPRAGLVRMRLRSSSASSTRMDTGQAPTTP